jgi:hypothetical protein
MEQGIDADEYSGVAIVSSDRRSIRDKYDHGKGGRDWIQIRCSHYSFSNCLIALSETLLRASEVDSLDSTR